MIMSIRILIPLVLGFVLTLLPSALGILLMAKGTQKDPYILGGRLRSPRRIITLLGLACQAPAIIYILSLYHTGALDFLFIGSK